MNTEAKIDNLTASVMPSGEYMVTDDDYCGCSTCLAQEGANVVGYGDTTREAFADYYDQLEQRK